MAEKNKVRLWIGVISLFVVVLGGVVRNVSTYAQLSGTVDQHDEELTDHEQRVRNTEKDITEIKTSLRFMVDDIRETKTSQKEMVRIQQKILLKLDD